MLAISCAKGHLSVVKYLIEEANVDPEQANDKSYITPLRMAINNGFFSIVRYLVEEVKVNL